MNDENVFARCEQKYLLTPSRYEALLKVMAGRTHPDLFSDYTVESIYYDTPDFAMLRASAERPYYKEKLRLRSYGVQCGTDTVYAELKKKCGGIVYKRRVPLPLDEAVEYFTSRRLNCPRTQILREIDALLREGPVEPKVLIAYERKALVGNEDAGLRITFDTDLRYRTGGLSFLSRGGESSLTEDPSAVLMEVKLTNAMPLWMARALSMIGAYPSSFSKAGTWYRKRLCENRAMLKGDLTCA